MQQLFANLGGVDTETGQRVNMLVHQGGWHRNWVGFMCECGICIKEIDSINLGATGECDDCYVKRLRQNLPPEP